jgi:protein arginine kinase
MTVDLSLLPDGGVGWLDASGTHSDIVLSTRIRLARNLDGYAFSARARDVRLCRPSRCCARR